MDTADVVDIGTNVQQCPLQLDWMGGLDCHHGPAFPVRAIRFAARPEAEKTMPPNSEAQRPANGELDDCKSGAGLGGSGTGSASNAV